MTTPWPINSLSPTSPNGDENVRLLGLVSSPYPMPTLPSLFGPGPASQARVLPGDTALSIRAKAMAFLERATYIARRTSAGDFTGKRGCQEIFAHTFGDQGAANCPSKHRSTSPELLAPVGAADTSRLCDLFYVRFAQFDEALRTFQASLPPLTPEDLSTTPLPPAVAKAYIARNDIDTSGEDFMGADWCPAQSPRTHTLICGHVLSLGASIQLHAILCETNSTSHARMLDCALQIVELSRLTLDVDPRITIVRVKFPFLIIPLINHVHVFCFLF